MDRLHQPALDTLAGRFSSSSASWPASRHSLLSSPDELVLGGCPSHSASAALPSSQGLVISLGLEPTGSASQPDGQVFRLLSTRGWFSRGHRALRSAPALEWLGLEVGTGHLAPSSTVRTPVQWRSQTYLVRSAGGVEQALDHSLVVRAYRPPAAAVSSTQPLSASDCSSLTLQSSLVANLAQSANPALRPDLFGPKRNLLVGGLELAYAGAQREGSNPLALKAFVDSDGLVAGMAVFKRWDRRVAAVPATPAVAAASSASATSTLAKVRAFISSSWPASLPRLQLGSTGLGFEGAWVQEARDYAATLGMNQQFRWVPPRTSSSSSSLSETAAPPAPASLLPPCTLSGSLQFYGHLQAALHVPVTRRLATGVSLHTQITNSERVLSAAATYDLNEAQHVAAAVDSRGGVRLAWKSQVRPIRHAPTTFLGRVLARTTLAAHVQAFPLLPQLVPAWTARATGLTGAVYNKQTAVDMRSTQITCGLSLEYNAD